MHGTEYIRIEYMPHAKLTLTIPEGIWVGTLTRNHPEATVRVLAALLEDEQGVGLVEVLSEDLPTLLSDMESQADVTLVDVLQQSDGRALVWFETSAPLPLLAARDSGVPLETPFEVTDGDLTWEVTAPHERLSELGEMLEALGVSFDVEYVRDSLPDEQLLTARQQRLVEAAVEAGYYDTPRECSLTELASTVDIAKSTASETLHRAEEKIVKQFAASLERPATDRD